MQNDVMPKPPRTRIRITKNMNTSSKTLSRKFITSETHGQNLIRQKSQNDSLEITEIKSYIVKPNNDNNTRAISSSKREQTRSSKSVFIVESSDSDVDDEIDIIPVSKPPKTQQIIIPLSDESDSDHGIMNNPKVKEQPKIETIVSNIPMKESNNIDIFQIESSSDEIDAPKISHCINETEPDNIIRTTEKGVFQTDPKENNRFSSRMEFLSKELKRVSVLYRIHRDMSSFFRKRYIFQMYLKDEVVYCAKGKGVSPDTFFIKKGSDIHLSKPPFDGGFTVHGFIQKDCELYKGDFPSVMDKILHVSVIAGGSSMPRTFRCNYGGPKDTQHMCSRLPKFNPEKNVWQLDFLGKFVLKSVKNCILDSDNMDRAVIIRKTTKEDLEIETYMEIDPLIVFGIGMGSFLT